MVEKEAKGKNKKEESKKSAEIKPSKKIFFTISVFFALVIAAVVFLIIGNNMYAPEKKIAAFSDAVRYNQVEELQSLLTTSDENFEISGENTEELITYLNSDPQLLENLEQKFELQLENQEAEAGSFASIDLVTDGKNLLFFDDYLFEVTPAYIHPMANADSVEYYFNDQPVEEVAPYTDKGYGPLMPGEYKILAEFNNSYVSMEQAGEVELYETVIEEVVHSFDFPVDEVIAHSNYDAYHLYVNGEKSDVSVTEGEQNIGEFPIDGSVSLFIGKDFPWGEVRSEEVTIDEESEVEFHVEHALPADVKTELMEKMNAIVATYQEALSSRDASLLQDGATNELKNRLKEHITEIEEKNPNYEGTLVRAIYDSNQISNPELDASLDAYTLTMRVQHVFHEPNGNLGWLARDRDKDEYTRSRELTVVFNEENGEWELHQNENKYFVIPASHEISFEVE